MPISEVLIPKQSSPLDRRNPLPRREPCYRISPTNDTTLHPEVQATPPPNDEGPHAERSSQDKAADDANSLSTASQANVEAPNGRLRNLRSQVPSPGSYDNEPPLPDSPTPRAAPVPPWNRCSRWRRVS